MDLKRKHDGYVSEERLSELHAQFLDGSLAPSRVSHGELRRFTQRFLPIGCYGRKDQLIARIWHPKRSVTQGRRL